jgi:hypothetical protein
MKCKRLS